MIPQIIYIVLDCLGFGVVMGSKDKKWSPTLVAACIYHSLLYWGGWYDCFLGGG